MAGLVPPAGRPIKLLDISHYLLLNFDAVAAASGWRRGSRSQQYLTLSLMFYNRLIYLIESAYELFHI